jgi:hypothetical protein
MTAILDDFVARSEAVLNTDEASAYADPEQKKRFRAHRTVVHSTELVGPNGENNNLAEEFNARFDRAEEGHLPERRTEVHARLRC